MKEFVKSSFWKMKTGGKKSTDIVNNISFLYFLSENLNRMFSYNFVLFDNNYFNIHTHTQKKPKDFKWKKSKLFWNFRRKCFYTRPFFSENLFENFLYFYFYSLFNFILISKVFLTLLTSILAWNAIIKVTVWVLGSWSSFLLKGSPLTVLFWSLTAVLRLKLISNNTFWLGFGKLASENYVLESLQSEKLSKYISALVWKIYTQVCTVIFKICGSISMKDNLKHKNSIISHKRIFSQDKFICKVNGKLFYKNLYCSFILFFYFWSSKHEWEIGDKNAYHQMIKKANEKHGTHIQVPMWFKLSWISLLKGNK